jgi:hypothetical protein
VLRLQSGRRTSWCDGEAHDNTVVRNPSPSMSYPPPTCEAHKMSKHPFRPNYSLWYPQSHSRVLASGTCPTLLRRPHTARASPCLRRPLRDSPAASPCQIRVVVVSRFSLLSHPLLPKGLRGLNPGITHDMSRPCRTWCRGTIFDVVQSVRRQVAAPPTKALGPSPHVPAPICGIGSRGRPASH